MKNKGSIASMSLAILAVSGLIFGIYWPKVNKVLPAASVCDLSQGACELMIFENAFSAKFEQPPEIEEELSIKFDYSQNLSIEAAWVEGINMYMGMSPLVFENPDDDKQGIMFLGSCNQHNMQWLLKIKVKNKATSEVALVQYSFSTTR